MNQEQQRMAENRTNGTKWNRWGPYLSYRQWGTVREDYSEHGNAWEYFPHDHARSRTYRWGEDGLFGFCDRHGILNLAPVLWNGRDPILKERLFGLTNSQGNHGEDVKEVYFHLDGSPSHAYQKALYKYPQAAFPYQQLEFENRKRTRHEPEYELIDTGIFEEERYFDVVIEYAKVDTDNFFMRITAHNRGPEPAPIFILPQVWLRNRWSWFGQDGPKIEKVGEGLLKVPHHRWGDYFFTFDPTQEVLFTENETNMVKVFGSPNPQPYVKDAFHRYIIENQTDAVNPAHVGTKAASVFQATVPAGGSVSVTVGLGADASKIALSHAEETFRLRKEETEQFYVDIMHAEERFFPSEVARVGRQSLAGLLWTKQHYHLSVDQWLSGDPAQPQPPRSHANGRNREWQHVHCSEVLSMPDKWEYPWFAAWDLAFHTIPFALIDPDFAKYQLLTLLREWYMHPNGQIPAYEWAFSDVNPPVHAYAAWRVYTIDRRLTGVPDRQFLERVFLKLLLNFTWWINRKDRQGNNIFEGGFLGLDNVGIFDRNTPLAPGMTLEQADGTSWMAMFCLNMLTIALELAEDNPAYEDIASKFFEHFLAISQAMNGLESEGLWCDVDGFYYDLIAWPDGSHTRVKVRSAVGLIPIFAVATIEQSTLDKLPEFVRRMNWYLRHMPHMMDNIEDVHQPGMEGRRILSLVPRQRMERILSRVFDSNEFFGEHGIRSVSKFHQANPVGLTLDGKTYMVDYQPAESTTTDFGGNSNWRGPIWFPINYLLVETLQRLDYYYGGSFKVDVQGEPLMLGEAAQEIERRLLRLFVPGSDGLAPFMGGNPIWTRKNWRGLLQFHEYFDGDTGRGLGANHQCGWTALVTKVIDQLFVTSRGGWVNLE